MTDIGIVYQSKASSPMPPLAVELLLQKARINNVKLGISGVLLMSETGFMQYLEGPPEQVEQVFDAIAADPRHTQVTQLLHETIPSREFAKWSMGYLSMFETNRKQLQATLGLKDDESASAVRTMLARFAHA